MRWYLKVVFKDETQGQEVRISKQPGSRCGPWILGTWSKEAVSVITWGAARFQRMTVQLGLIEYGDLSDRIWRSVREAVLLLHSKVSAALKTPRRLLRSHIWSRIL